MLSDATSGQASARSEISVDGMTCAACASRIQRKLSKVDGVSDARVNFANGRATVVHRPELSEPDFFNVIEGLGYHVIDERGAEEAERRRERDLRHRLTLAVALSVPAVLLSMVPAFQFSGWHWVVAALTTPVVFWSGWNFHRSAGLNIVQRATTMDTLVSLGSLSAWSWSMVVLLGDLDDGTVYFETAAVIVTLILLGKWLELRARRRSGDALRALADLGAKTALLETGQEIALDQLGVGMRFVVRPGEKVATDGIVVEGHSAIDASMLTGEPVPVEVGPGASVFGATINANGSLTVEATGVGGDTALAQVIRLVDQAQGSRADVQRLADRVSSIFVPVAIGVAAITLVAWVLTGHTWSEAFTSAVAVLIIACPCALGLATPLGIMVGTGRGAELGVIIKGGEVLEDTRAVDAIVLDKTGTVTEGRMAVTDVHYDAEVASADREDLVVLAASLEHRSEHPIARALCAMTTKRATVSEFENRPGLGVVGVVEGTSVSVGRRSLFDEIPVSVQAHASKAEASGSTAVFAGRAGIAEAVFVVADQIRPTSQSAIAAFKEQGLAVTLLTGDNERTARAVASAVGIERVVAEVMPADKVAEVERLQASGHRVAMIGDGINDAPALAQADLGIAIGTGTDVAIEASDLTIISGDLLAAVDALALARQTLSTIRGNLFWAFAYNSAAIPLAALGFLNPMIAAGAMGLSSLFVVSNSLRLRRFAGYRQTEGPR